MEVKFYKNKETNKVTLSLLGKKDPNEVELVANSVDAAREKHVPVIEVNGKEVKVSVGSVLHPMLDVHYIEFIALVTDQNAILKRLEIGKDPVATFKLAEGEKVIEAYAYCNLHGLWVAKI